MLKCLSREEKMDEIYFFYIHIRSVYVQTSQSSMHYLELGILRTVEVPPVVSKSVQHRLYLQGAPRCSFRHNEARLADG